MLGLLRHCCLLTHSQICCSHYCSSMPPTFPEHCWDLLNLPQPQTCSCACDRACYKDGSTPAAGPGRACLMSLSKLKARRWVRAGKVRQCRWHALMLHRAPLPELTQMRLRSWLVRVPAPPSRVTGTACQLHCQLTNHAAAGEHPAVPRLRRRARGKRLHESADRPGAL